MDSSAVLLFLHAAAQLKPRVLEGLCSRETVLLFAEHLDDNVLGLWGDGVPEVALKGEVTISDPGNDLLIGLSVERRLSAEQDVEDDTDAPDIALFSVGALDDFRSEIVGGAKDTVHGVLVVDAARGAKVDKFDDLVMLVLKVYVLRLDITMHNAALVQVVDCAKKLSNHISSLDFAKLHVHGDAFVKGTAVHHFVDEVHLLAVFVHLNHLTDIGMVKLLQKFNLFEKLAPFAELQVLLANDLDSASNSRSLVDAAAHARKGTFSDLLMQVIVVLDVVLMIQVELLRVELNAVALIGRIVGAVLHEVLEVLAAESDELLGLLANDLLDEVLQDAGERVGHLDLLRRKDAHLSNVRHFQ